MLYRYRLNRLNEKNRELKTRVVQGVKLNLKSWVYSRKLLIPKTFLSEVVEEQVAEVMVDFIEDEYKETIENLEKRPKGELKQIVSDLGYEDSEIEGKKKADLVKMIREHSK